MKRTKEKTTYTSNKVEEIKKQAEERGLTMSELLDRYVLLGSLLDRKVQEGHKIYFQRDGDSEKGYVPVEEFLETLDPTGSD